MKTLFAGPFVGEFGMELFTWQSHIREISKDFDKTIVSSRSSNEFLYRDFYDEFVPYEPISYNCDGYECIDQKEIPNVHENFNHDHLIRVVDLSSYLKHIMGKKHNFFSYKSSDKTYDIDICVCARNFKTGERTKILRNWDFENCKNFVENILDNNLKVASIGLSSSSLHIPNTENFMDISLEELSKLLSSCKFVVGPSSGVMHFASLCECPQIVWGEAHLEKRYKQEWNPFCSKVIYLPKEDYSPSIDELMALFKEASK